MTSVNPDVEQPKVRDGRATRFEHRRGEILEAVVDYVLEHGGVSLSLRAVAAGAGVSHATLLHHFESKERLVDEVLTTLRARAPAPEAPGLAAALRAAWTYWSEAERVPAFALQFESYAFALRNPVEHQDFLQRTVSDWLDVTTTAAIAAGCPPERATVLCTGVVAEVRGLLLDLSATQDRQRVTAAFHSLLTRIEQQESTWQDPATAATR